MADPHAGVCASVTAAAVKEIVDTDLTDARVNNFINMAYFMTLRLSGKLGDCGGAEALCAIQLLLAAHYLTMYERTLKSESIAGEWSATYALKDGDGLKSSLYGQNAIDLDCSGTLAKAGLRRAWLSVISHEQIEAVIGRYLDDDFADTSVD